MPNNINDNCLRMALGGSFGFSLGTLMSIIFSTYDGDAREPLIFAPAPFCTISSLLMVRCYNNCRKSNISDDFQQCIKLLGKEINDFIPQIAENSEFNSENLIRNINAILHREIKEGSQSTFISDKNIYAKLTNYDEVLKEIKQNPEIEHQKEVAKFIEGFVKAEFLLYTTKENSDNRLEAEDAETQSDTGSVMSTERALQHVVGEFIKAIKEPAQASTSSTLPPQLIIGNPAARPVCDSDVAMSL
jgi:hypothetical protein